jgi:hypothetical protein
LTTSSYITNSNSSKSSPALIFKQYLKIMIKKQKLYDSSNNTDIAYNLNYKSTFDPL